ncbi:MAG: copper resistance protein CopC, partial [Gemmatimonadota bacterium]|nr:copper resistance protein CopC [Gemmatimonadota bacterium]
MNKRILRIVCAAALMIPAALLAHARLTHSTPADRAKLKEPPKIITLEFSEAPEIALTTIALTGPGGVSIALGPVAQPATAARSATSEIVGVLAPGAYRVSWTTAASDGHPSKGTFTFDLLPDSASAPAAPLIVAPTAPSETTLRTVPATVADQPEGFGVESPVYVIIRWLQFLAILVIIGAVAFRQLVLSFLKRKEDPDSAMIPDAARNAAHLGQKSAALLLAVLVVRLVAQSYMMHGGMGGVAPAMMVSMV